MVAGMPGSPQSAFAAKLREQVLPLRARADLRNEWLKTRLDTILPEIMAREGFDPSLYPLGHRF